MNTTPSFSTTTSPTLSSKEYAVIRAYLLGLSEATIMQLLQLDRLALAKIWEALYKKFKRNNPYVLIQSVVQLGLIEIENYLPETAKTATLAFIDQYQDQFPFKVPKTEGEKWVCYHFLLKYQRFLVDHEKEEKKIPPKRD